MADDNSEAKSSILSAFYLRDFSIKMLPDAVRVWVAIAFTVIAIAFIVCTIASGILLVRLGWNAVFDELSTNQETIKNFLLAFASTFGIPFLIWRTWAAHQQSRAAEEQARVAVENHITGIFSKSVELMGAVRDSKSVGEKGEQITRSTPNIESRLGALYSLERLLAESEKDQRAILETLCAYIRENSPLEIPEDEGEAQEFLRGNLPPHATRRADVQAALTIIGRRPKTLRDRSKMEAWRLDLRNANLVAYDFSDLNFDCARFDNSFLNNSNMTAASFENSTFHTTFIRFAKMTNTKFCSSTFNGCDLKGAEIERTDFSHAILVNTDLRSATVHSVNIRGTNLEKAFGGYLKFSLERVKEEGPNVNAMSAMEILSVYQFFGKASHDDMTKVSEEVREAILIMGQSRKAKEQRQTL